MRRRKLFQSNKTFNRTPKIDTKLVYSTSSVIIYQNEMGRIYHFGYKNQSRSSFTDWTFGYCSLTFWEALPKLFKSFNKLYSEFS